MRIVRVLVSIAAAMAVLIGALAPAASAAEGGPPEPQRRVDRSFPTIDDAVASGRIDREVADAVHGRGAADAIVTVDQATVIDDAEAGAPAHDGRTRHVIDAMRAGFAARKAKAFGKKDADVDQLGQYENLPSTHVRIKSKRALLEIANHPDVTGVRTIHEMTVGAMDAQSAPLVRQPQAAAAGYRGAGAVVAVLDSGLDHTRADFGSCTAINTPATCRVVGNYEIAPADGMLDDNQREIGMHGTNVAGIAAGIAPAARIIGLDIFNGLGTNDTYMLSAMNWLIGQRRNGVNIVAANLSVWTKTFVPNGGACADGIGVAAARAAGIVPVIISGNGGWTTGASYPGCIPGALTVGAVYDSNVGAVYGATCTDTTTYADKVTCFSQSGPNVKMLAPGSIITAAGISQSGTSQAAPHVAGAVAVLAAAKATTIASIERALVTSGPQIRDRDGVLRRRLDVYSALSTLFAGTDTSAPAVSAPAQTVAYNWALGPVAVPVTVTWNATDASGIGEYAVYRSVNGGAWTRETLTAAAATAKTFDSTPGSTYRFAVAAKDGAGNWSGYSYGPTFRVDNHTEASAAVRYSAGWSRVAWSSAYGGYLTTTSTSRASATFTFTGRGFALVASKATNRGEAWVYIDGTYVGVMNLYEAATRARVVSLTRDWNTPGTHTVQLVAVGTSGRPTIDVDSFIVLG